MDIIGRLPFTGRQAAGGKFFCFANHADRASNSGFANMNRLRFAMRKRSVMSSSYVVFYKIATTCLLIFVGFIGRRMKILPENSPTIISKFLIYLANPAYVVYYMPQSITRETLHLYWMYPLIGFILLAINDLFAYSAARLWARPGERATFRILVGLPNWVYMALAVCIPLFGEAGVRVVLLFNIGITFYVWTFGMTSFRSAVGLKEIFLSLFYNIQTFALALGVFLALFFPAINGMEKQNAETLASLPLYYGMITPFWETVYLVGSTALPLSILQIGMLLGTPRPGGSVSDTKSLMLTSFLRLLAAPALTLGVLALLYKLGLTMGKAEFITAVIVMAMPAAVLSLSITEVYGGATRLAAKGIMWTNIASLLTAPLVTFVAEKLFVALSG